MTSLPFLDVSSEFERMICAVRFMSVMTWPNDEEIWHAAEANFTTWLIDQTAKYIKDHETTLKREISGSYRSVRKLAPDNFPPLKHLDLAQSWREMMGDEFLEPLGGLELILDSPSRITFETVMNSRIFQIGIAGDILLLMAAIDRHHQDDTRGGASVKKAVHILLQRNKLEEYITLNRQFKESGYPTLNRTSINAAWREFKPSAHLCAAYCVCKDIYTESWDQLPSLFDEDVFWTFGTIAKDLELFATNFVPRHGSGRPLVPASEMNVLPDDLFESDEVSHGPLESEDLEALKTYRAPKPD